MASLPPKIDRRTYNEIVRQLEDLVEQLTEQVIAHKTDLIGKTLAENNIKDKKLAKEATEGKFIDDNLAQKLVEYAREHQLKRFKIKGWKPDHQNTDAGGALIRIFSRMVKLVSDRLNRVPEKNFLAFLDLIGGELQPPQPAKVPLTFYLAEGSPVDGLVPAHTQVSSPPAEDAEEEIVFETEGELVVTTAQLQAVFVREPRRDKYSDRTLEATGQKEAVFEAFAGDRDIPHLLYISCPEIFNLPELPELKLIFTTDNASTFRDLQLTWSSWQESYWQEFLTSKSSLKGDRATFTFSNLPILTESEINGRTKKWLQIKLTNIPENLPQITNIQGSINLTQSELIPEVCLFNNTPLDLSKDCYPFGEQPQHNDTLYIALHDTFVKANTTVTINVTLSHKPVEINNLQIAWEIGNGQIWQEISTNNQKNNAVRWITSSSAIQFIESDRIQATLQFPDRENLPSPSTVNGETRYWIRARIIRGHYGKAASERKYSLYDDLAVLTEAIAKKGVSVIKVDTLDLFKVGDSIRLLPNQEGFPEEHQIKKITPATNKLTLNRGILNESLAVGTRIMRKLIIAETIPPTYDPPLIKSLTLNYDFTLTENAVYVANNDFNYSHPDGAFHPFTPTSDRNPTLYLGFDGSFDNKTATLYARVEPPLPDELSRDITTKTVLEEEASEGTTMLQLADVTGWEIGNEIEVKNPSDPQQGDRFTIRDIRDNQVTIDRSLPQKYSQGNPVNYPKPELVWEYSSLQGWQPLGVRDETQAFSQSGLIQFIAPADFGESKTFGQSLYWLRVGWQGGNFRIVPRLRRISTNTTRAVQASTFRDEILGSSNADLNQVFVVNNTPVLLGERLEIQEREIPPEFASDRIRVIRDDLDDIEEIWVLWQEVQDFYSSGASDRHYILDRQTGEIRFGDGQTGMIPPRGRNNLRLSFYRSGGGKQGNVADETIAQLKTTIPYIDRVVNLEAAAGGAEQESLDRLQERVPKQLRHRDRAVTIGDFADLAYEASTDVARVKVVTPDLLTANFSPLNEDFWLDPNQPDISLNDIRNSDKWKNMNDKEREKKKNTMEDINRRAGQVKLIILPHSRDRQPVPSLALLDRVETYIRSRCEAMVDLIVTGPKWQEVTVTASITPVFLEGADVVRTHVKQRLEAFLHPLTGGTKGEGWQFSRYPHKSDFYALIQSIAGVDRVDSLQVDPEPASLEADTLIYSGNHNINLS
ncbi:MAG: baseplate J/gp47 family protein [Spirulina sp.]